MINGSLRICRHFASLILSATSGCENTSKGGLYSMKVRYMKCALYMILIMFLLGCNCMSCAAENSYQNRQFEYSVTDGEITITRYIGKSIFVYIPDEINGIPVTQIGISSFYGKHVKAVFISDGIKNIIDGAFEESGLVAVRLPSTLVTIGDGAFAITPLKSIVIPEGVSSIGFAAFAGCTELEKVQLPSTFSVLQGRCFHECLSLKQITIPEGVEEISEYCFYGCIALERC